MKTKPILSLLFLAVLLPGSNLHAQIFVTTNAGTVAKYNLDGSLVNASLVSGVSTGPSSVAVSGTDIFTITSFNNPATFSEYTTSGAPVNVINTGLNDLRSIAVSGTNIFVTDQNGGLGIEEISEYTTSGATLNTDLATLSAFAPSGIGIVVSGTDIFVATTAGTVDEYTTVGGTVNASLLTGLNTVNNGIAVSGTDLLVSNGRSIGEYNFDGTPVGSGTLISGLNGTAEEIAVSGTNILVATNSGTIAEYNLDGSLVNASLVSRGALAFAVEPVPEPSTWVMLAVGSAGVLLFRRRRRVKA